MASLNVPNGLVSINDLWKTDRAMALALLTDFHGKFKDNYAADEMVSMAHLEKRMDRQNNTNSGGNPTTVWTSIIVNVQNGKIAEGRLSELYPHGTAVPTYDFPVHGKVSKELADADLAAAKNPDNKANAQGVDTAYEGQTWRDVVSKHFLGQAMEVKPEAPTPDGFARVPIHFMSPPMKADGQYTRLDLCWRNENGTSSLAVESVQAIRDHITGFYEVCANEHLPEGADVKAYVQDDKYYKAAMHSLIGLDLTVRGSRHRWSGHNRPYPANHLR